MTTATGAYTYAKNTDAIEGLDDNEKPVDSFTVTVCDGDGPAVTQTYTVNLSGADDAPTLAPVVAGSIAEVSQNTSTTDSGLGGTLAGADVDVETLTYGIDGGTSNGDGTVSKLGTYGTLTVTTATGAYTYAKNTDAIEGLDDNEKPVDSFTVTVSDGDGPAVAQTYTVNLTGADDAPTLAPVVAGSIAEVSQNTSTTDSGLGGTLAGADVDVETLTYGIDGGTSNGDGTVSKVGTYGTLTVNATTGLYSYVKTAAVEGLDAGETASDSFTVTVSDGDAPLGTQTYTVNLSGADDAPTLAPVAAGSITEVNQSTNTIDSGLSGTLVGADVDGETLTYGIDGGTVNGNGTVTKVGTYGTLTVNATTSLYSYVKTAAVEGLDAGETASDSFTVTVSDGDAPLGTQTYTVNLSGADDAPTLAPVAAGSIAEVSQSTSTIDSGLTGTLVGADVDVEPLTYGIQGGTVNGNGTVTKVGTYGTLTVTVATGAYSYVKNAAAVEALNSGQSASDSFTVTVSDGDAPLGTQTYTVNITGANDNVAPVGGGDRLVISNGTTATFNVSALLANDTDVNGDRLHLVSVSGANVTYDANTQTITYNAGAVANNTANAGSFTYQVSDGVTTATANVTVDTVNASPGFNLATTYAAGAYQAAYLDFGGGGDNGTGSGGMDTFLGGSGDDTLVGGTGGDILRGGTGDDTIDGGAGIDLIDFSDTLLAGINFTLTQSGTDTPFNTGAANLGIDTYKNMEGVVGTNFNDILNGSSLADVLMGGGGNDTINGNGGADTLIGGLGKDTLTGGLGADTFVLIAAGNSPVGSGRDVIVDFLSGTDEIDLTAIDANSAASFDQAFQWGGMSSGTVANSITWSQSGADTIIRGDITGDTTADFEIQLTGLHTLDASDFLF